MDTTPIIYSIIIGNKIFDDNVVAGRNLVDDRTVHERKDSRGGCKTGTRGEFFFQVP